MAISLSSLTDVLSWIGLVGGGAGLYIFGLTMRRVLKDGDIGEQNMLVFPLAFCITAVLMGLGHILKVRLVP